MSFIKTFLADLITLRTPETAATVATAFVALVHPFGLHPNLIEATAFLTAVGVLTAFLEHRQSQS